jgi:competence protein ComFC
MRLVKIRPLSYLFDHLSWSVIDLLFPPFCGGCQVLGERWCSDCQNKCQSIGEYFCKKCGQKGRFQNSICPECQKVEKSYSALRTWVEFSGPMREALHRLKYRRDIGLGEALSKHLVDLFEQQNWPVDFVTSVPLSPSRLKARGYNQASLLARPLAHAIDIPFSQNLVFRIKDTRTQVGLKAFERRENVQDAFKGNSNKVNGKIILVIDDVTTTGATIESCARALCDAGAKEVFAMTLSRAALSDQNIEPYP